MQKVKLAEIANVKTGYFGKPGANGRLAYLQVRDFTENGQLLDKYLDFIEHTKGAEKHVLKPNDIIFAAKGTKNFAIMIKESDLPAVASTSFFRIRLQDIKIMPEFLTWYLNYSATKSELKAMAFGSAIPSIPLNELENLEIPILKKEKQLHIIHLVRLQSREKEIMQEIIELKKQINNYYTTKILK